jgi:CCR4-NOT complex subunit CAF16
MEPAATPAFSAAFTIEDLTFAYAPDEPPVLRRLSFALPRGVRCLLVGANGAGKTTMLTLLAGRHMVADRAVRVLGRPAFSDTSLVEHVALLGGAFPFDVDIRVDEILDRRRDVDPERRDHLVGVLGVDPRWHMHRVSDGQRRRVQILLSLLEPRELLLLDEVTTDLDVIARADLLAFLRRESVERGATILYATHILDGLDRWATHLAFLDGGAIRVFRPLDQIDELTNLRAAGVASPLLRLVEHWLRRG